MAYRWLLGCLQKKIVCLQLKKALAEAEARGSEQLEEAELRHGQLASDLREAAEEAGMAAETASQNVEQWRRRWTPPPPHSPRHQDGC